MKNFYGTIKFLCLLSLLMLYGNTSYSQEESNLVEHVSSLVYHEAADRFATADDGVKWQISSDGKELLNYYDSIRGIHYGSSSVKIQYLTFKTSNIPNTYLIKRIVVNASTAKGSIADISIKVGNNNAIYQEGKISDSPADYSFDINQYGAITVKIRHPKPVMAALYLKSIKVYYSAPPCADIVLSDSIMVLNHSYGSFDIKKLIRSSNYTGTLEYSIACGSDVASISDDGIVKPLKEGLAKVKIMAPAIDGKFAKTVKVVSLFVDEGNYENNIKSVRYDFTKPKSLGFLPDTTSTIRLGNYFNKGMTRIILVNQPQKSTTIVNSTNTKYLALSPHGQLKIDVPEGYLIRKVLVSTTNNNQKYYLYDHEFSGSINGERKDLIVQSLLLRAITNTLIKYIDIDYRPCLTLSDDEDNTTTIAGLQNVTNNVLVKRSLSKEYWNTFCLPFSVTKDSVTAVMGEVEIKEYSSLEKMNMIFTTVDAIEAGKPYLIKPQNDISYLLFNQVKLEKEEPVEVSYDNEGCRVSFVGTYGLTEMKTDGTEFYVSKSGDIKKPSATTDNGNIMKGMRAIIRLSSPEVYKMLQLNMNNDNTDIMPIEGQSEQLTGKPVYNLNGQRLYNAYTSDMTLNKGVYIIGGRKMIIK